MIVKGQGIMFFKRFTVGELSTNCYLIACNESKEAAVIDPGYEEAADLILKTIKEKNFKLKFIINTHGHSDHIGGNKKIRLNTTAKILIHRLDSEMLTNSRKNLSFYMGKEILSVCADRFIKEGNEVSIGTLRLKIIHTPGHSPGSICLVADTFVLTGDTLFFQGIGRTDLPGGSYMDIVKSIKEKLFQFDDSKIIYPGHGQQSTIGEEKLHCEF